MSKLADTHSSGFDALDGFDLDDEFLDLDDGRPGPALTPPPAAAPMSVAAEAAFVQAAPPAVATPSALNPVSG
ncbi:MAG TPA: pilus assembly protein CpaE, partial [Brevundimonas sp.]|nr:pilus assembly protein CpaE [Brevundimonas sp.]